MAPKKKNEMNNKYTFKNRIVQKYKFSGHLPLPNLGGLAKVPGQRFKILFIAYFPFSEAKYSTTSRISRLLNIEPIGGIEEG
jgi:hypothetical protein